jgi:VWFA-related protein
MKIPTRSLVLLAAVALMVSAPAAEQHQPPAQQPPAQNPPPPQPPPTQQPPPRIKTGINYVSVDVIVSDKSGNPVLDLAQDDFTLTEDGKPQKIDAFSVVKIDVATQVESAPPKAIRNAYDEEREAARPDVRLFVILLDDYHVRKESSQFVRKPLMEFLQNQLAPADMVALMYPLTPITDLSFSRDRDAQARAITTFEGRKFNYEPRNSFEQQYANYPTAVVERVRNQVTMDALKGAALKLAGLREGRKSVIFVSEGFTATIPCQLSDQNASMPGFNNPNRGNALANCGGDLNTDRLKMQNNVDLNYDMRDVFDVFTRANTSIYAVDPRGLATFEYSINEGVGLVEDLNQLKAIQDTLHVLANNTDGRAIVNRNDIAAGMKQIMRDASGYYLLGYNSSQAPTDGKFHKINVDVKRKGVSIRARKGYWAYTLEEAAIAKAPPKPEVDSAVTTALGTLAAPARGRPARFWIGTERAESGATHVTFVWEPVPPGPGDRSTEKPARVVLTALAADGKPLFKGRVPDAVPAAAATADTATGGLAMFEVPPGQFQLKMVVEGERGQVIDSLSREMTAPDFTSVQVSIGTPQVFRARTIRELQALKGGTSTALPLADREFSRTDRIYVRVSAYAPGGTTPALTATLLNRGGTKMSDLPVQAAPGKPSEIELPLAALATGEYLIELNAKTPSGTAQELIPFRIGR